MLYCREGGAGKACLSKRGTEETSEANQDGYPTEGRNRLGRKVDKAVQSVRGLV